MQRPPWEITPVTARTGHPYAQHVECPPPNESCEFNPPSATDKTSNQRKAWDGRKASSTGVKLHWPLEDGKVGTPTAGRADWKTLLDVGLGVHGGGPWRLLAFDLSGGMGGGSESRVESFARFHVTLDQPKSWVFIR
jgi:hypothetical protein